MCSYFYYIASASHLKIVLQDIKLACKHIQCCSSTNKVDNNIDQLSYLVKSQCTFTITASCENSKMMKTGERTQAMTTVAQHPIKN